MNSPIAGLRLAGRMMFDGNSNAAPAPENGRGGQLKWGRPDEPLNAKHRAFVNEYLKDGNASRAAVAAGYSPNRGKETGCELLQNPRIAAAVMARNDELAANLQAARAQVVAANQDVADRAEAAADEIAEELQGLSGKARGLMTLAEGAGDLKTALAGLREISRLLELKAKLAGRIAGAQIQINLAKIDVAMLSDADLQAFLERARDRVARIQQRQLDNVISDEDTARVLQAEVVRTLSSAVGWPVTIEMAVEALKAGQG